MFLESDSIPLGAVTDVLEECKTCKRVQWQLLERSESEICEDRKVTFR
jgi:hypothetical protein